MQRVLENAQLDQDVADVVDKSTSSRSLDSMNGSEFVSSVTSAEKEAVDAVEALDDMVLWLKRLKPYFDLHPGITVAQALQLFVKDHPRKPPA